MRLLLTCCCLLAFISVNAQLTIYEDGTPQNSKPAKAKNKLEVAKLVEQRLFEKYADGYLTASLDSLQQVGKQFYAHLSSGNQFSWKSLHLTGNHQKFFRQLPKPEETLSQSELYLLFENIITHYENNGYPFASVQLKDLKMVDHTLDASLKINKGPHMVLDSIKFNECQWNSLKPYIESHIEWKQGSAFSVEKFQLIEKRINEIAFLQTKSAPTIEFRENGAILTINLKKKKANVFNGIIGFQPDNKGDLTLTGSLDLKLVNSLKKGEVIQFNWRSIKEDVSTLDLLVNYPYLFQSKFGLSTNLNLYRRSTEFTTSNLKLGLQYLFSGNTYFEAYVTQLTSSLLSTEDLQFINKLPDHADSEYLAYGIEFSHRNLDYVFNPRKGYQLLLKSELGNKEIIKNPNLPERLYDDLIRSTLQSKSAYDLRLFLPIKSRATIMLRAKGGGLLNSNLFENELYRIGGRQLRGFDEESIFASQYHILTFEPRFILEKNSFAQLFFDYAFVEANTTSRYANDQPFGFGLGFSFETKAGIFNLAYALGKQQDNPIEIKTGKIHFGFVNYF